MQRLRRQLILIARQLTDDAPLLIGLLAAVTLLLLGIGLLAFVYPANQMLYATCVLIVLPFLASAAMFFLGAAQAHGGSNFDGSAASLLWPITPRRLAFARIIAGAAFVVVIVGCLSMAISGAAIFGLIEWPESLLPQGLIDWSVAMLLVGLACYGLGLAAGRRAGSFVASLWFLPPSTVLVSLIVIKGFGQALVVSLVPFILALCGYALASPKRSSPGRISLGFVCLLLVLVPLYWIRFSADVVEALVMLETSDEVSLALHGDFRLPPEHASHFGPFTAYGRIESQHSLIHSEYVHYLLRPVGIVSYLQSKEFEDSPVCLRYFGHRYGFYYDEQEGLFVDRGPRGTAYIGPQGMADVPAESLGRFLSPVVCRIDWSEAVVLDRGTRTFYAIDTQARTVHQEQVLPDVSFSPVSMISPRPGVGVCSVSCYYPSARGREMIYGGDDKGRYLPLVDESGAIAVLERPTWKVRVGAGHLPCPHTLFGRGSSKPRNLVDYTAQVIVKGAEKEYAGLIVGCISPQGVPMTLAVFDKDGRLMGESWGERRGYRPPAFFTIKYLVESLHPPVLTLASFFTAYSFEAGATHRAVFLMPNSFVALQRDRETGGFFQFLWALLLLAPAVSLSGFLSWRVVRDAAMTGEMRQVRVVWLAGTVAFGLPAYITYRLTRPRVVMKPCANCGRTRRIDRDLCHHCGRGWEVPEFDPPAWRITDSTP